MQSRTSGGKAYPLFRPSVRNVALALGVASGTVLSAGAAYMMGAIVDGLASGGLAPDEIAARLAAFLGVSLAAVLAKFSLNDWLPLRANLRAEVDASDEAIDQLLAMSQRAFERHDAGHYLNVVNAAAFGYGSMSVYLNVNVVGCAIAVVALLACAAAIDVILVPVFLCGLVVYFVVNWGPMHSAGRLLMEMMAAREAWQEEVRRLVEEKRVANAGGAEGFYLRRFEERTNAFRAFLRRHRLADATQATLPAAVSPALQGLRRFAACVVLMVEGSMTLGAVVAAWQLFSLLQSPMADICSLVSFYVSYRPNLVLLRDHAEEAEEPSGFEALAAGEKDLAARMDGTLWATPARGADGKRLWTGEFEVRPGELVVVKGANGSGKSRLLDLLRGLSDPADLDGTPRSRRGCSTPPILRIRCPWYPARSRTTCSVLRRTPRSPACSAWVTFPGAPSPTSRSTSRSASARSWACCARSRARSPRSFSTSRSPTWTRPRPRGSVPTSQACAVAAPSWPSCTRTTSTPRPTASTRSATPA